MGMNDEECKRALEHLKEEYKERITMLEAKASEWQRKSMAYEELIEQQRAIMKGLVKAKGYL